jgi:hypothetical protein
MAGHRLRLITQTHGPPQPAFLTTGTAATGLHALPQPQRRATKHDILKRHRHFLLRPAQPCIQASAHGQGGGSPTRVRRGSAAKKWGHPPSCSKSEAVTSSCAACMSIMVNRLSYSAMRPVCPAAAAARAAGSHHTSVQQSAPGACSQHAQLSRRRPAAAPSMLASAARCLQC